MFYGNFSEIVLHFNPLLSSTVGIPRWLRGKESTANAGDAGDSGLIPGSGRSPWGGNGNPLQYSCLGNPTNREAWWASVHGLDKSRTPLKQLNGHTQRGRGCSSLASPRLLPTAEFTCPLTIYQQTYKVIVARAVFSVRIRVSLLTQFSSQPCRVSVKVLLCV